MRGRDPSSVVTWPCMGVRCWIQALHLGRLAQIMPSAAVMTVPWFAPGALCLWGLITESSHPFAALPSVFRLLK